VGVCKDFVLGFARVESYILENAEKHSQEEWRAALEEVFQWLQTTGEIPPNSYTRELAREILGQLTAAKMISEYRGSSDHYIM